jgi:hypothetical protein
VREFEFFFAGDLTRLEIIVPHFVDFVPRSICMNVEFTLLASILLIGASLPHNSRDGLCSSARGKHKILCELPYNELWSLGELCGYHLSSEEIQQSHQSQEGLIIARLLSIYEDGNYRSILDSALEELSGFGTEDTQASVDITQEVPKDCWSGPHIFITEPQPDNDNEATIDNRTPDKQRYHREFVSDEVIIGKGVKNGRR